MIDMAWYLACPECADAEGPYLCHGPVVKRLDGGLSWIRNHAGGLFTGASDTKEEAVRAHTARHQHNLDAARARVTQIEATVAEASALSADSLRVIEVAPFSFGRGSR